MPSINTEKPTIPEENVNDSEEVEVRPITQTDHLNKKLLTAFLNRVNIEEFKMTVNQLENSSINQENDSANDFE